MSGFGRDNLLTSLKGDYGPPYAPTLDLDKLAVVRVGICRYRSVERFFPSTWHALVVLADQIEGLHFQDGAQPPHRLGESRPLAVLKLTYGALMGPGQLG